MIAGNSWQHMATRFKERRSKDRRNRSACNADVEACDCYSISSGFERQPRLQWEYRAAAAAAAAAADDDDDAG
jgi:hypothetical protein